MKRGLLLSIIVILLVSPVISAGLPAVSGSLQHGILGYVISAKDGTSPNGAVVTFNVYRGTDNYCTLTDIVGRTGNAAQPNWYAQDLGNCETEWQVGDSVEVNIVKGPRTSDASVSLTPNGSDQIPSVRLSSYGLGTVGFVIIAIVISVTVIFAICFFKLRKSKFKSKKFVK
jgi:hypothetical protein